MSSYLTVVLSSPAAKDGNATLYLLRMVRAYVQEARLRGVRCRVIRERFDALIEAALCDEHGPEARQRVRRLSRQVLNDTLQVTSPGARSSAMLES